MNFKILSVLAASLLLLMSVQVQAQEADEDDQEAGDRKPSTENFRDMYQKMLKTKRQAHREAVQRIFELKDGKKQSDMLALVIKKLFEVLDGSLRKLNEIQENSANPETIKLDQESMNELSMIIENTAFGADLSLHFPDKFHRLYDKNQQYQALLASSLELIRGAKLVDLDTEKALHLMSQELNLIEREPNYVNPYRKRNMNIEAMEEDLAEALKNNKVKVKAKKAKRPRGPGLSGGSRGAGEL